MSQRGKFLYLSLSVLDLKYRGSISKVCVKRALSVLKQNMPVHLQQRLSSHLCELCCGSPTAILIK